LQSNRKSAITKIEDPQFSAIFGNPKARPGLEPSVKIVLGAPFTKFYDLISTL
jgi:hypothetical protein